jgi:ABC-type antimicrobial peptide transport system permease subunit
MKYQAKRRYVPDKERKEYPVQIFLNEMEYQRVKTMARTDGHSMSAILRKILIPAITEQPVKES